MPLDHLPGFRIRSTEDGLRLRDGQISDRHQFLTGGAGAEARRAIGLAVVAGLSFATLLTLVVVPVLWALLARYARPAGAVAAELRRLERTGTPAE